jgi:hypothetical protein
MKLRPTSDADHDPERRRGVKQAYGELYSQTEALFFRHDPIEISFGDNTDEYDAEVSTVLPRLRSCSSAADVQSVLHEEFSRWFGVGTAGSFDHYAVIGAELWTLWHDFNSKTRNA